MFINSTLNYFRDNIFLYINGKISKNQVLIHFVNTHLQVKVVSSRTCGSYIYW